MGFLKLIVSGFLGCVLNCRVGGEGGGPMDPRSGGSKGGGPKISRFFFPLSPAVFYSFLPSLGGLSRGILVVFEAPGRSNVHVWSSWAVV